MPNERLTILFSGMVAGDPYQGGATWSVLQYVLGLRRLGHRVVLVEPVPAAKLRPVGTSLEASDNAAYFARVVRAFGLEGSSSLLLDGTRKTVGLPYAEIAHLSADADVLLNVSGMLRDADLLEHVPMRVYLDLDPVFNQLWQEVEGIDIGLGGHTHFVTVGQALGRPECPVPTCGHSWLPTLPPVVLECWPFGRRLLYNGLTTVANWRGYGSIWRDGVLYGQKAHSLRELMSLPSRTSSPVALALAIHPDERRDLDALQANGWRLLDPERSTGTPARYRRFVRGSRAELGVAKSGYVVGRSGWFSDRSACYLASGRPVVAQDTGFDRFLPTGEGLLSFATVDDALSAVDDVERRYARHRRAARALAEEHFESGRVLTALLDRLGAAA
jgi:hypothetical protein